MTATTGPAAVAHHGLQLPPRDAGMCVAVLGGHRPLRQQWLQAYRVGADLARAGVVTVTTGGPGVEVAAMTGALDAGGRVAVLLSHGLNAEPFPRAVAPVYEQILWSGRGTLASMFPDDEPPTRANAALRDADLLDRVRSVVIVAGRLRSSAARIAAAARDRDDVGVWAVPCSPLTDWLLEESNAAVYTLPR